VVLWNQQENKGLVCTKRQTVISGSHPEQWRSDYIDYKVCLPLQRSLLRACSHRTTPGAMDGVVRYVGQTLSEFLGYSQLHMVLYSGGTEGSNCEGLDDRW
jgi:hypothetical protein